MWGSAVPSWTGRPRHDSSVIRPRDEGSGSGGPPHDGCLLRSVRRTPRRLGAWLAQNSLDFVWWFHHISGMTDGVLKLVDWIGSSYKDFRAFPEEVQDHMGYALHKAQTGAKHEDAKPLKGFGGAGVMEIVSDHVGDTYRAVYTVKFATAIYVLHAFQKKSKTGIKTPAEDMELIQQRLKVAEADYKSQLGKRKSS